jgi:hypothetical protein
MSAKSLFISALALFVCSVTPAQAERPPEPKKDADLVVTGRVAKVYTNIDEANVNHIIEIEVASTEKGQAIESGQILDARCFQRRRDAPRVPAAFGHHQFPLEGQMVKAYLMRRTDGRYEGTYPDWIDPAGATPGAPPSPEPGARPRRWALGVFIQPVPLGDRLGLRITQVQPGGPAQRAGLEAGDIITEAGSERVQSQADLLRAIAQSGGMLKLTVRDVRTGNPITRETQLDPR